MHPFGPCAGFIVPPCPTFLSEPQALRARGRKPPFSSPAAAGSDFSRRCGISSSSFPGELSRVARSLSTRLLRPPGHIRYIPGSTPTQITTAEAQRLRAAGPSTPRIARWVTRPGMWYRCVSDTSPPAAEYRGTFSRWIAALSAAPPIPACGIIPPVAGLFESAHLRRDRRYTKSFSCLLGYFSLIFGAGIKICFNRSSNHTRL